PAHRSKRPRSSVPRRISATTLCVSLFRNKEILMQRSKQQALMFLLGATLVGGVLGFSAERVISKKPKRLPARVQMYDDIGIDYAQRVTMDSILDDTNCRL